MVSSGVTWLLGTAERFMGNLPFKLSMAKTLQGWSLRVNPPAMLCKMLETSIPFLKEGLGQPHMSLSHEDTAQILRLTQKVPWHKY